MNLNCVKSAAEGGESEHLVEEENDDAQNDEGECVVYTQFANLSGMSTLACSKSMLVSRFRSKTSSPSARFDTFDVTPMKG